MKTTPDWARKNIDSYGKLTGISHGALSYIWSENSHPKSEAKDGGN